MESLVLRNWLRRLLSAAGVVMIALLAILFARRYGEAVCHRDSGRRHGNEWQAGFDPPVKRYVPATSEELQSYLGTVNEIVQAFSNGQAEAMCELVDRLPPGVYRLRGDDHRKVFLPLNQLWYYECKINTWRNDFATEEEFERYLHTRLTLIRIYGDCLIESGMAADNILLVMDFMTLERMQSYEKMYQGQEEVGRLAITKAYIQKWTEHIESEHGFAREHMRVASRVFKRLVEIGEFSDAELSRQIRLCAGVWIKRCGYTPKWLDEEFPLPEGEKDLWEK